MKTAVRSIVAGNMWKILVEVGDEVHAGDTLFIMEVMKMEVLHEAAVDGTVTAIHFKEGDEGLNADNLVIEIESAG